MTLYIPEDISGISNTGVGAPPVYNISVAAASMATPVAGNQ